MASVGELEREPRMRPGRPSSGRCQRSSHVVGNVFKFFSTDAVEHETVKNLVISRPSDVGYQQMYVDQLKAVEDQRSKRLDELRRVENHLMKAYGAATAADERRLNQKQEECPGYTSLGLPSDESELLTCLDEKLLRKHNLVVPSALTVIKTRDLKKTEMNTMPRYAQLTKTSQLHRKVSSDGAPPSYDTSTQHNNLLFMKDLRPSERHAERQALDRLDCPINYKCNPRLNATTTGPESNTKPRNIFVAEPESVAFTQYELGNSYQIVLQLRNVDSVSRQLRVIPPTTEELKIDTSTFPSENGVIAPGLTCQYTITFTPRSLADCSDHIKVIQPNGYILVVPIEAHQPAPQLSLSSEWDCGYCLVGGQQVVELECTNHGADTKIRILMPMQPLNEFVDVGYVLLPPFEIQPSSFCVKYEETVYITVIFCPDHIGSFSQPIRLVTESEHILHYTLTGVSEEAHIELVENDTSINFSDQNPGREDQHIVSVRNHSHIALSYHWRVCYPPCYQQASSSITARDRQAETLTEQAGAVFSVCPDKGKLPPQETTLFSISFRPLKSGCFQNVAELVLDHVPHVECDDMDQSVEIASLYRRSPIQLPLMATCLPVSVELVPPAALIPSHLLIGESHKRQVKLINHSKSFVDFHWQNEINPHNISVEPQSGTISVAGERTVELIITPLSLSPVHCNLACLVSDSLSLQLPVHAAVKGIDVVVEVPRVLFGLVRIGQSSTVEVEVSNRSTVSTQIALSEQHENSSDQVVFTPLSYLLPPLGRALFHATFTPTQPSHYSALLHCRVDNGDDQYVNMSGECQECSVCVDTSHIHLDSVFITVPAQCLVMLRNQTKVATRFHWTTCQGEDSSWCDILMEPLSGELQPGESRPTTMTLVASKLGEVCDLFVSCHIDDSSHPVYISITAEVKGLSVSFATPTSLELQHNTLNFDGHLQLAMECQCGSADGSECVVVLQNNSALSANFSIKPLYLKSPSHSQPFLEQLGVSSQTGSTRTATLTRTPNLADPLSKSMQQSKEDYVHQLLSNRLGAVLLVNPSEGRLRPFDQVKIIICGYADMWGQYSDSIVCQVEGMESFSIPTTMSVSGSPLAFVFSSANQRDRHPTVRFGSHVPDVQVIERTVRLQNKGPMDVRVDWHMFGSTDDDDDQLIDVDLLLGDPFPLVVGTEEVESDESLHQPLVGINISEHIGARADIPVTIQPAQLVVPSYGQASMKVLLRRDQTALTREQTKKFIDAFALGYLTPCEQTSKPCVIRRHGLHMDPLHLGVSAHIKKAQVTVEADDDDYIGQDGSLIFNVVASSLIRNGEVSGQSLKLQPVMLTNHCQAALSFQLHTEEPFRITNRDQLGTAITLRPQATIQVRLGMLLSMALLERYLRPKVGEAVHGTELLHTETGLKLVIHRQLSLNYTNGSQQVVPVKGYILLPQFEVSLSKVAFNTVLVGETSPSTFQLTNPSLSETLWTITQEYTGDGESPFYIVPMTGVLFAHTSHSSSYQCTLTCHFSPKCEGHFKSCFSISGALFERPVSVEVEGSSSFDQKYNNPLKPTH